MRRRFYHVAVAAFVLAALGTSGCVERRFIIDSDPPGAVVFVNGKWAGATPTDQSFGYYGKYRFVFVRDGYETLTVDEPISTPWWSYFPLEFIVENMIPYTIRDIRYIQRPLQPRQEIPPEVIRQRGDQLRAQGALLGPPGSGACGTCNPGYIQPGMQGPCAPNPYVPGADLAPVPMQPMAPMPEAGAGQMLPAPPPYVPPPPPEPPQP